MAETYTVTTGQFTFNLRELGELVSPYIVTDNDNTEQFVSASEVEEMVSDIINYNFDFVTEEDVVEIARDYCDSEDFVRSGDVEDMINNIDNGDVSDLIDTVDNLRNQVMSLTAEIDFLHEKHVENVERRLGQRFQRALEWFGRLTRKVHWHMPRR